jgi:hypothetical protein
VATLEVLLLLQALRAYLHLLAVLALVLTVKEMGQLVFEIVYQNNQPVIQPTQPIL